MDRGDLSDGEWALIEPLLPSERGRWARPAGDNRRFLNGMLHVLRVGCPWRDMHERYGKWNSVYVRFRRWAEQGVWDGLLQTLVDLGLTEEELLWLSGRIEELGQAVHTVCIERISELETKAAAER